MLDPLDDQAIGQQGMATVSETHVNPRATSWASGILTAYIRHPFIKFESEPNLHADKGARLRAV
jgi:hypothetical protein